MSIDPRLENYLSTLDRALLPLSVSERADIVTEIKSHILQASEKDEASSLGAALAALGEAEMVANRYLMERNLKPGKPPVSPVVKWVVIGFLGTLAILVGGLVFLFTQFSPLVEIDGKEERVSLLGGLIRVDGEDIRLGGQRLQGGRSFSGSSSVDLVKGGNLSLKFANGRISLASASGSRLQWSCRTEGRIANGGLTSVGGGQSLDLSGPRFVKCEIMIPEGANVTVEGVNGSVQVERPRFSAKVELANGKVEIEPDPALRYGYKLAVTNGKVDSLPSDPNPEYQIEAQVANGKIYTE